MRISKKGIIKVFLFLILAVLLISVLSFAQEKYDFRKTRWGMSKEEVKLSEGRKPDYDNGETIAYAGEKIANLRVNVYYSFVNDKLYRGGYGLAEKYIFKNKYIDDYKKLKELLVKKYGQPLIDRQIWHDDLYKDDPIEWGLAISIGHLEYLAGWERDNTNIRLVLEGENYKINLFVVYESKQWGAKAAREKEKESIEKL